MGVNGLRIGSNVQASSAVKPFSLEQGHVQKVNLVSGAFQGELDGVELGVEVCQQLLEFFLSAREECEDIVNVPQQMRGWVPDQLFKAADSSFPMNMLASVGATGVPMAMPLICLNVFPANWNVLPVSISLSMVFNMDLRL